MSLVPVLLGDGVRFFGALTVTPVHLTGPEIFAGQGVTHLTYQVIR